MSLADLQVDDIGKIVSVDHEELLRRRLYDLGFIPGSKVECVLVSPFHSPILYKVNGAFIALRKNDAKKIEVAYEE